ncbi:MAG: ubiquinol-cytochrome c reductase iron-sulfur subunit [Pseudomonadota bacterium]|nr:ubiquinol-cytochrome c reductase iron-sulfur subunit [Pseudomonadota bacterium]
MSDSTSDHGRRRFLIGATSALGAAGVVAVAVPFVSSMLPSARAKAAGAPVEVDISRLESGMKLTSEWRGQPVWVVSRTPAMLEQLAKNADRLRDPGSDESEQPDYCKNPNRSTAEHPEVLVVVGICTHLGCSPQDRMKVGNSEGMPDDWPGGFFCPCHGSKFDMAARVFKGVPAPTNMKIPPHQYLAGGKLLVGADKSKGA